MYKLIIEGTAVVGIKIKKHADNISVVIPEGITEIGKRAFLNTKITNITLPQSLVKIDEGAFMSTKLCSITFPKGVKSISRFLFKNCSQLQYVDMSQCEITEIPCRTFYRCTSIKKVKYSKAQGDSESNETNNTENVVILPPTIRTIGRWAFCGCCNIEEVELNEGLETICTGAFEDDTIPYLKILPKKIELPESLKQIKPYGIYSSESISLTLKKNISSISSKSFHPSCKIKIVPENPYYYENNGCVISKNEHKLVFGGVTIEKKFSVPDGVEIFPTNSIQIQSEDYNSFRSILEVIIPPSVRKVVLFQPKILMTIIIPDTVKEVEIFDDKKMSACFQDLQLPPQIRLSKNDVVSTLRILHRFKTNTPLTEMLMRKDCVCSDALSGNFFSAAASFLEGDYNYDEDVIEKNREVLKTLFENMDTFRGMEGYFRIYDDWTRIISLAINWNLISKKTAAVLINEIDFSCVEVRSKLINLINNNSSDNLDL